MAKTKEQQPVNERVPVKRAGPMEFFRQVRAEVKKVTWPTRHETTVSTIAVFAMVFIASLFLFTADQIIASVIRFIMSFTL